MKLVQWVPLWFRHRIHEGSRWRTLARTPEDRERWTKGSSCARERTSVGIIQGPSGGCGRSSAKQKAAWTLSYAFRAVSPRIRLSFIDRQYSPSTGMDRSECEIILGELICMGLLVKQVPVSECDD
jgi:hypothetical protein